MINCQQLIDFCFDYIDGALPVEERLRFTQHLGQCSDCMVFFETYRRTPELTREALATQIPPNVRDSVRSFLRAKRGPTRALAPRLSQGLPSPAADRRRG